MTKNTTLVFVGGLVLVYGLWKNSIETKTAAYFLFIISAIGAGIVYLTGEAAEETVENKQGIVETTIKQHEVFALFALISLIILGVASILGLFLNLTKSTLTKTTGFVILFISLISFGLVAKTGYLGGEIRHTEISNDAGIPSENSDKETDE